MTQVARPGSLLIKVFADQVIIVGGLQPQIGSETMTYFRPRTIHDMLVATLDHICELMYSGTWYVCRPVEPYLHLNRGAHRYPYMNLCARLRGQEASKMLRKGACVWSLASPVRGAVVPNCRQSGSSSGLVRLAGIADRPSVHPSRHAWPGAANGRECTMQGQGPASCSSNVWHPKRASITGKRHFRT